LRWGRKDWKKKDTTVKQEMDATTGRKGAKNWTRWYVGEQICHPCNPGFPDTQTSFRIKQAMFLYGKNNARKEIPCKWGRLRKESMRRVWGPRRRGEDRDFDESLRERGKRARTNSKRGDLTSHGEKPKVKPDPKENN